MAYKTVILAKEKGVATITLNRPEVLNAINSQLRQELREAVEKIRKDEEIRVLLITGAGDKAFVEKREATFKK